MADLLLAPGLWFCAFLFGFILATLPKRLDGRFDTLSRGSRACLIYFIASLLLLIAVVLA